MTSTKVKKAANPSSSNDASKYDEVPYESFPYPNTHPERLYTIGKLFGMQPVDFKNCKVLELGCASGGNLIPYATMFPDASFTGIDLSEVQINQGKEHVEKLGLKNITLKTMSITDINAKFGKFDYIIAHGILSWVPKNVQDKIFEIFSKNLTKNGIAYVSYNTLPGWNAIRSIREMMLLHTSAFETPAEKLREARLLLKFIQEENAGAKTPYAQMVEQEIETLSTCPDSYLLHDHLEENNEPFYFYQVAENAGKNDLQYLGDTAISTMFHGNFSKNTAQILEGVGNDIVKLEQYMDFLRNRRFRTSLFCHKDVVLNRNLKPECLEDFFLLAHINTPVDLDKIDITNRNEVVINFSNGAALKTANPAVIIAIRILLEQKGKPIATKELMNKLFDTLGSSVNKDVVREAVFTQFLRLVLADAIGIFSYAGNFVNEVSKKPKVSELARYQAQNNAWVTNQRAEKAAIDLFNKVLVQYLDGNNDVDTIISKMVAHVENDDLAINMDGKKIVDKKVLVGVVDDMTRKNIENLVPNAVLVA